MIGNTRASYNIGEQLGRRETAKANTASPRGLSRKPEFTFLPDAFSGYPARQAGSMPSVNRFNKPVICGEPLPLMQELGQHCKESRVFISAITPEDWNGTR